MNAAQREVIGNRLHIAVTLLALWLVTTSPWVSMLRRVPAGAGFFDYAHMVLGVVALFVGILYGLVVVHGGRWKLYFPLAAGAGAAEGTTADEGGAASASGCPVLEGEGRDASGAGRLACISTRGGSAGAEAADVMAGAGAAVGAVAGGAAARAEASSWIMRARA